MVVRHVLMCTGHQTAKQAGRRGWDCDRGKDVTGEEGLYRQRTG